MTSFNRLLERTEELGRVELALADARAGRGRIVVVEGPAGVGKTALLAASRTVAVDAGLRVLRSRGDELERDFAFGVVRQLFEPALAKATKRERAHLLRGAAGVAAVLLGFPGAAAEVSPSNGVDSTFTTLHGLYWLTAHLAATEPLCVIVDDANWADAPSLRYLAFLLPRLDELPVALVLAAPPRGVGAEAELLADLTADPSADVIRLPPLTRTGVAKLLETKLDGAADPALVDACMRATRGTPFLMHALVDALAQAGIASPAETGPRVDVAGLGPVGRSIRLRLRRLPDSAERLARALAVLEEGDLHVAATLADLDEAVAADAADALSAAGIFEPGRPLTFVHPIVRTALYSELSSAERANGHRRAARLLAERPDTSERVAHHLLASEPAADAWVVERLSRAARAALRSGAPETAAVFLRRVLDEPPASGDQPGLLVELGVAEANAGLDGWPAHLQQAVDAAPDAEAAAGAARALARAFNRAQRFEEAVEVLDRAASGLEASRQDLALQLEAAAVIAGLNELAASSALALRRTKLRERVGDQSAPPEVIAAAAVMSVLTNEPATVGAELATRALKGEGSAQRGLETVLARTTLSLLWAERYAEVRPLVDGSIVRARETGDSGQLAVGLAARSLLAFRVGDLAAAEVDARAALVASELPAPPLYRNLNAGVLVDSLVDLGRLDEAAEVLARFEDGRLCGSLTATVLCFAHGRLRVAAGRVAEGLEDLLAVGGRLTQGAVISPSFLPWRSEAALAHLALGDRKSALRLVDDELELARAFGAPRALGVALRAAGVVTGGDRGELLLREALEAFERGDARLEHARAQADLGAMLRRRNRRTQARELLREALDAAHRAGATRLAAFAETELRAAGARPRRVLLRGLEALTASERRIAEFASEGLTNREIAQTLFVTPRTVEGHLTSIFRKLQLGSRAELDGALAGGRRPS